MKVVTEASWQYLEAYLFFKKSCFPNPGTWMNQSQKYFDAMQIIERELVKIKEAEVEEGNGG